MTNDNLSRACAILEEELGEIRQFADLPASEIETIAARLVRALAPMLDAPAAEAPREVAA